jgi:hypothetical protein
MAQQLRSPGYYPAPDGNGEQWWNGVSWSESRRGARAVAPGPVAPLVPMDPRMSVVPPAQRIAAPAPYAGARPSSPSRRSSAGSGVTLIVIAALGFAFWFFAGIALIGSIGSLLTAGRQRSAARIAVALIALVIAVVALATQLPDVIEFFSDVRG